MIGFGISGGSFYLKAQALAVYLAHKKGYKADYFIGTSAGAIISFVAAVLGVEKLFEIAPRVNFKEAISNKPFNENGKISFFAAIRVIFGKSPVSQDVTSIIKRFVTVDDFAKWKKSESRVECFVTTANITKGKRCIWDLSLVSFDTALAAVEASARMQSICSPLKIGDSLHSDGGQFDHNPAYLLPAIVDVKTMISIWSRPKNWQAKQADLNGFWDRHLRMIELDNIEKSLNDEQSLVNVCEDKNIELKQIYIDRVLAHQYDDSDKSQRLAIQSAIDAVKIALQ